MFLIGWTWFQDKNLDWFPRMRAMSLTADDSEGEQNELRNLQDKLDNTNKLVLDLSQQLLELKDQVCVSVTVLSELSVLLTFITLEPVL